MSAYSTSKIDASSPATNRSIARTSASLISTLSRSCSTPTGSGPRDAEELFAFQRPLRSWSMRARIREIASRSASARCIRMTFTSYRPIASARPSRSTTSFSLVLNPRASRLRVPNRRCRWARSSAGVPPTRISPSMPMAGCRDSASTSQELPVRPGNSTMKGRRDSPPNRLLNNDRIDAPIPGRYLRIMTRGDRIPNAMARATPAPPVAWHRRLSARFRVLPDHLILGAQKSGTTQLDRILSRNPGVLHRAWKETRTLVDAHATANRCRGYQELAARARRFERERGHPMRAGDACPFYLFHPESPAIARRVLGPDLRFVVLLRDPVHRAWSHHRHEVRLGGEPLDFVDAMDQEAERLAEGGPGALEHHSYLARGDYATQLERWFDRFDREAFLVEFSETFFSDPDRVVARVEEHLDLPATPPATDDGIANRGDGSAPPPDVVERLRRHFADSDARLETMLGRPLPWRSP